MVGEIDSGGGWCCMLRWWRCGGEERLSASNEVRFTVKVKP